MHTTEMTLQKGQFKNIFVQNMMDTIYEILTSV